MYTLLLYTFIVFLLFNITKLARSPSKYAAELNIMKTKISLVINYTRKKQITICEMFFFRNYTQFTAEPIDYQWNKTDQQSFMSNLIPSGQDTGTGRLSELLPTPQMTAEVSTSLYGTSCVISSHSSTPYDLQLHHQLHHLPQFCVLEKKMTPVNY